MPWVWVDDGDDWDAYEREDDDSPPVRYGPVDPNDPVYLTMLEIGNAKFSQLADDTKNHIALHDMLKRGKIKFGG